MPLPGGYNFIPSGSAAPSDAEMHDASNMMALIAPIATSISALTTGFVQSYGSNGVQAGLPTLGITPSGSVGQVATTPEGNVRLPVTPLIGMSPSGDVWSGVGGSAGDAAASGSVDADWRSAVRVNASHLANFAAAMGGQWDMFVRAMVRLAADAGRDEPSALLAKMPSPPYVTSRDFYTGPWQTSWGNAGAVLGEIRDRLDGIRQLIAAGAAADAADTGTDPSVISAMIAGGMNFFPTGETAEDLVNSVASDLPGGSVATDEGVMTTVEVAAPSTPPWVWVLGGACALAVVGAGVALATRK